MLRCRSIVALALAALGILSLGPTARAADHLDAPSLTGNGQRDINDVYAFQSPTNPNNAVFVVTVNPFAGQLSPSTFGENVVYDLLIDNNGDAQPDVTYSTTFSAPTSGRRQDLVMTRNGAAYASGSSVENVTTSTGGTLRADVFDDPFFFDLAGFRNGLNFTGANFFEGADVGAIVLEVPRSELGSDTVGVYARTLVNGQQADRMGRPAINTALIPSARKEEFNQGDPADDPAAFGADVRASIQSLNGGDAAHADQVAGVLLPDLLTFDASNPNGFLNGRRLADDVIDAELNLLSKGAVTTDLVNNDSAFRNAFPYLAAPQVIPLPAAAWMALGTLGGFSGAAWLRRRFRRLKR